MTIKQWQARRNWFNHDWLKNKFQLSLDRFVRIIDGEDEDTEFVRRFVSNCLVVWEREYPCAIELIDTFEEMMSPRLLFASPPLNHWPKEETWMPSLVHALWQARLQTSCLVNNARDKARQANQSYRLLRATLEENLDSVETLELDCFRIPSIEFRDCCRELSKAFEHFPHRVTVT